MDRFVKKTRTNFILFNTRTVKSMGTRLVQGFLILRLLKLLLLLIITNTKSIFDDINIQFY